MPVPVAKPVPLPEPRPRVEAASSNRFSVTCADIATIDETPAVEFDPRLPEPPRRKRGLSEEDRALWESVAKQVKPLRKRQRVPKPSVVATDADSKVVPKPAASPRTVAPQRIVAPSKPSPPPLAPIGRRERSHLSRGRKEIDARLDLHGMTQTRAHRALFGFLQRAHHDGLTFVLIITGKGKMGASPSAACCAARCRNGSACRNSARWWSASRKPISDMAARAPSMSGCGARRL